MDREQILERIRIEIEACKKNGRTFRKIEYIADFQYIENGKTIVEDVKGIQTDVFKLKHKIFEKSLSRFGIKNN